MRFLSILAILGLFFAAMPVMAKGDGKKCTCSKSCSAKCAKGEGKDCKCKVCNHKGKSGKKCKSGQCSHSEHNKDSGSEHDEHVEEKKEDDAA